MSAVSKGSQVSGSAVMKLRAKTQSVVSFAGTRSSLWPGFVSCRATQQALLTAPWPTELIGHHRSCIRTSTKTVDSAERAVHLAASEVLFRGLRVRMGIGTGIIEKIQVR